MSFGFSIGDLVAVGTLAHRLSDALREAAPEFEDCANLCHEVGLVIEGCRPNNPNSILKAQDSSTIKLLAEGCKKTLNSLESLLRRYNSLGSTNHRVRDTLGFAYAKGECDKIRKRLGEHLLVINTFLTGSLVSTPDSVEEVTPELFFALFTILHEERPKPSDSEFLLNLDTEDGDNWASFRAVITARADISGEYLDQKKSYVQACVQKIVSGQTRLQATSAPSRVLKNSEEAEYETGGGEITASDRATSPSAGSDAGQSDDGSVDYVRFSAKWFKDKSAPIQIITPARPKGRYDPWEMPWFTSVGSKYLKPVEVGFDLDIKEPPCIWRYSKEEEWLCNFPEGWSRTPTLMSRDKTSQQAYYYCYNNLSFQRDNRPKASRAYFAFCPFSCDEHASRRNQYGWYMRFPPGGLTPGSTYISWQHKRASQPRTIPPSKSRFERTETDEHGKPHKSEYIGFVSAQDGLPWDLDDEVSRELAESLIGPTGTPMMADFESISESLPEEWMSNTVEDSNNMIYINTEEGWNSTVHPARFTETDSEISSKLPEHWDRRLDSWGNLFFVDHHTQSATREDPRFNKSISQDTGLPIGWRTIADHQGASFFFRNRGKMMIGTYDPTTMTRKDLRDKIFLAKEPEEGDQPVVSKAGQELLGKKRTDQIFTPTTKRSNNVLATTELPDTILNVETAAQKVSMPTTEKVKYYTMFDQASKAEKWTITLPEALENTKSFELPAEMVEEIWRRSDSNHDQRWDIEEYANAMHEIMVATSNQESMSMPISHK